MTKTLHQAMKVGAFLGELFALLELYVLVLLAPGSFNAQSVAMIGFFGIVSCAFAYFSSTRFDDQADMKRLPLTRIIAQPPFVVWIAAVLIILFQLTIDLRMVHLANRK